MGQQVQAIPIVLLGLLINVFCVLKLCNAAFRLMDVNFEVYLSVEILKFKLLT
jgi:hypothetical protein